MTAAWDQPMHRLRRWARIVRHDLIALFLAARDPRVPWHAKFAAGCVAAYAFSPLDLIPDFIPVLGYVDDLFIVPLGILLAVRLIPPEVLADLRKKAEAVDNQPSSRSGAIAIVVIWLASAAVLAWLIADGLLMTAGER